ncbi:hypothetical protein BO78DRAFT_324077 [Aspergillus sclerotiicarbonarius CBS 121057]|uniref:Uncharacterized protein n=1 Tax=Aspergillus sclerotiicarbonarius (strain CBS 121057 / IBT 28362) TaxID=1448318 RepID=A0A319DYP0_ASPSB|nr:hypothetical protein BO78DRAFT_324077 [Aspergillus sclerotiicarbonarius CBS 121057]
MSAAIHTQIVNTDAFFPSVIQPRDKGKHTQELTPWIFEHADFADLDCIERWPRDPIKFKEFFHLFNSHVSETNLFDASLAEPDILAAYFPERVETVTLPTKSWKYSTRENFAELMRLQGMMLRTLIETIYLRLKMADSTPRLHFPVSRYKQVYFIGGRKYTARPDGAVMIRLQNQYVPVLSFTGWFQEQTWSEFLGEILSIMLGQLAHNIKLGLQDQEIFVLGSFKRQIFIARGFFTKDQISRAHAKGFSASEKFHLALTRGYELSNKDDWYEAMQRLVGLLRYLVSGNARVGGLQTYFSRK